MIFNLKKSAPRAPETTLTLHDVAPEHAAVSRRLAELCRREDEIIAEMNEIRARVEKEAAKRLGTPSPEFQQTRRPTPAPIITKPSDAAAALLGDLAPAPKSVEQMPPQQIADPDWHKLQDLAEEIAAVREAIAHLREVPRGERYSVWERTHLEGSKAFCEKIAPEYADVAKDYLDALIELGRAHLALEKFTKERLTGVAFGSLRPVHPLLIVGDPRERTSEMRRLLAWAVDVGRLDAEDIPVEWDRREV